MTMPAHARRRSYLFGVAPGTAIVLLAAAVAASVSFLIGRTIGRDWILQVASGNDRFRALDSVISQEGFKIVLLLRLSPPSRSRSPTTSTASPRCRSGTISGARLLEKKVRAIPRAREADVGAQEVRLCRASAADRGARAPFRDRVLLRERRLTCTRGAPWARPCSAATTPGPWYGYVGGLAAVHLFARAAGGVDQGGRGNRGRREGEAENAAQIADGQTGRPAPTLCASRSGGSSSSLWVL